MYMYMSISVAQTSFSRASRRNISGSRLSVSISAFVLLTFCSSTASKKKKSHRRKVKKKKSRRRRNFAR